MIWEHYLVYGGLGVLSGNQAAGNSLPNLEEGVPLGLAEICWQAIPGAPWVLPIHVLRRAPLPAPFSLPPVKAHQEAGWAEAFPAEAVIGGGRWGALNGAPLLHSGACRNRIFLPRSEVLK